LRDIHSRGVSFRSLESVRIGGKIRIFLETSVPVHSFSMQCRINAHVVWADKLSNKTYRRVGDDLWKWAGAGSKVYWLGREERISRIARFLVPKEGFKVIERIKVPMSPEGPPGAPPRFRRSGGRPPRFGHSRAKDFRPPPAGLAAPGEPKDFGPVMREETLVLVELTRKGGREEHRR